MVSNYFSERKRMSSLNNNVVCLCGKKKLKLNETNWKRHVSSCKIVLKHQNSKTQTNTSKDLTSYFPKKRQCSFETDATICKKSKYQSNILIYFNLY